MLIIESNKNSKIKEFLNLSKYKKLRTKKNLCVLEGLRLIIDAFRFKIHFKQIFLIKSMFKKLNLSKSPLLEFCPYNLISDNLAKQISSVENSQGIFAIVEKPKNHRFELITNKQDVLVLVEINNPGNVGTLIRSAAAFNFRTIVLANCCDVYNVKTIRSSMSSVFKTKILECSINELKTWLNQTSLTTIAAVSKIKANQKVILKNKATCALLIGNEANGLPENILNICKAHTTISMQNDIESLNAAIAGSILMFNLSDKRKS